MNQLAIQHAKVIFNAATPIIKIHGVGGRRWKRNIAKGGRIGPWLQGSYDIVNDSAWRKKGPCLYLVAGTDGGIRYVGISRNGVKHRWRTSPAFDAETMVQLTKHQLFHSQCWKHIERESQLSPAIGFEVRAIEADALLPLCQGMGAPLSAFAALEGDGEGVVAGVERWLCNNRSDSLVSWNVSMTR